jgi:hypothetical protein
MRTFIVAGDADVCYDNVDAFCIRGLNCLKQRLMRDRNCGNAGGIKRKYRATAAMYNTRAI